MKTRATNSATLIDTCRCEPTGFIGYSLSFCIMELAGPLAPPRVPLWLAVTDTSRLHVSSLNWLMLQPAEFSM